MKMSKSDIAKYPRFFEYVSVRIPLIEHVKPIMDAIKKLAGKTPRATIIEGLQWAKGPTITIVPDLVKNTGGNAQTAWGSDVIELDLKRVTNFEARKGHLGRTKQGRLVYLVGVTLLHELTHWADAKDGVDDAPYEEGDQYEIDVYGQFVR
jgi:hypothetical protein